MASEAEVDLVISTADTLPQLERDLEAIITRAENGADSIDLEAALALGASLSAVSEDLERVIQQAESGAADIELEAALDAGRSLNQIQSALERVIGQAERGETIEIPAELEPGALTEVAQQVRALVTQVEAVTPPIEIEVDIDRNGRGASAFSSIGRAAAGAIPSIASFAGTLVAAGPALAGALSAVAGLVAALQQVGPAAAVAVPAMASMILVSGTLKLAMQGVGDAIKAAFDPDVKPEELEKALKRLAPEARKFVLQLKSMKGEFKELQQDIQGDFFNGFSDALISLRSNVLPQVATALRSTAVTLNQMALGAAAAAIELGANGTLQTALLGATEGLANLRGIPGQVVTALGQLGAAAAPAFDRVTKAVAKVATDISEKLAAAFESGSLEDAINGAVDAIAQLGRSIGNVFEGIGNIFSALQQDGEGLFATLEKVTEAFADVTSSQGFQDALKALSSVLNTVVENGLPLLTKALEILGPIFQELGPPIELLVETLGDALKPILDELGPVLLALADAFAALVADVRPLLELAGVLIAAALPLLTPLFEALEEVLRSLTPFIKQISDLLAAQMVPVFNKLATEVLPQLLPPLIEFGLKLLPVIMETVTKLTPILTQLALTFAEVAVAMVPLILALVETASKMLDDLMPVIGPLIDLVVKLIEVALKVLVWTLTNVVIPAINILVDLLNGDFNAAWKGVQNIVQNVTDKVYDLIRSMGNRLASEFDKMVQAASDKINELVNRIRDGFQRGLDAMREKVERIPDIVRSELSNAGTLLYAAGTQIVQGLIDGLNERLGRLRDIASQIADTVKNGIKGALGISSPSKVMMDVGEDTIKGFEIGISSAIPSLRKELQGVASLAPSFALPNGGSLRLPSFSPGAPTVQVFLGNELINRHVDTRIAEANRVRDRIGLQGVRR